MEIIVYRNPAERAFWEMLMSGAGIVYILTGVAFILGVIVAQKVVEMLVGYRAQHPIWIAITMLGGALVAITFYFILV